MLLGFVGGLGFILLRLWQNTAPPLVYLTPKKSFQCPGEITDLRFSPSGSYLATVGWDRDSSSSVVILWDVIHEKYYRSYRGFKGIVAEVGFTSDDKYILIATTDNALMVWDIKKNICKWKYHLAATCIGLSSLNNDSHIVLLMHDKSERTYLELRRLNSDFTLLQQPFLGAPDFICFSPDSKQVGVGDSSAGNLKLLTFGQRKMNITGTVKVQNISDVVFAGNQGRLLMASRGESSYKLLVYGVKKKLVKQEITVNQETELLSIAASPKGRLAATATRWTDNLENSHGMVKIWSLSSSSLLTELASAEIDEIPWSAPDVKVDISSTELVACSDNKQVRVWSIQ